MEKLFEDIEKSLRCSYMEALNKGAELKLSPINAVDFLYYYFLHKKEEREKDEILIHMGELTLSEIQALFEKIREEHLNQV